jgi:GNAT superfamily N-acetyltransferase
LSERRPWPLVVRRARPDDRDAVLAFASRTWDDWDYIPHAWPRWLDDPEGVMLVATRPDGTPVAIVRVAVPAPGEAWLEGIRVDPQVRGMDVATDLQVAELHWAAASGARVIRYATSARNEGSHRLGARGGFEHIASLLSTWYAPDGMDSGHGEDETSGFLPEVQADARRRRRALLEASASSGRIAALEDGSSLWSAVSGDPSFNAAQRLYEPRPWALEELTESKFLDHVRADEVLVHRNDDGLAVALLVADVAPAEDAALRFALLSGAPTAAFELLEDARGTAGEPIRFRYAADAPLVQAVEDRYRAAGYDFSDWALHLLARPLDEHNPPPPIDMHRLVLVDAPSFVA